MPVGKRATEADREQKPDVGVLPKAAQRKPGWQSLGPYMGRKRPDGITRGWC